MRLRLITVSILLALAYPTLPLKTSTQVLAQAPTPTAEEKITEAITLNNNGEGIVYKDLVGLSDLQAGLEMFQQALAIFKKYNAKAGEANSLTNIGYVYLRKGEYSKALDFLQQSLAIRKQTRDRQNEWIPLSYIGEAYINLGQYPKALDAYQETLTILKELRTANPKDSSYSTSQKGMLANTGALYFRMGQYQKALELYQQTLAIQKADNDRIGSADTLNNIGVVYINLGSYTQALDSYQQALTTVQDFCYKEKLTCYYGSEAAILNNFSSAYFSLGQYQKSLELAEKSANIYKKFRTGEYQGTNKQDIQLLYDALGQNPQALQQITSRAVVGDAFGKDSFQFQGEALNLNNIGQIYFSQSKYDQALKLYQQALDIYKQNNYPAGIAVTQNNIANIYANTGKYAPAIESNQQALTNYRAVGDRTGEGVTFSNLGQIYQKQNQYDKALGLYQQALAIHREVSDKASETATLKYLGDVLANQNQPQLAIAFYKQSVNLTETIRQSLRVVPTDIQKSYTETVADRYRRLADLLLKQNRPSEAQQVLDLLKIQEVKDFIGNSPVNTPKNANNPPKIANPQRGIANNDLQTAQNLPFKPQEQEISQKYSAIQDKVILLGKELTSLRKIHPKERTSAQEKRMAELVKFEQDSNAEFNKFIKSPAVVALVQQLSVTSNQENLNLRQLNSIRDNLRQLRHKAVLLYPLVLEDRLELVIVTADSPPIHRTVKVTQAELNQTIQEYRKTIVVPRRSIKEPALKLYNWLIKPIENDLKQADAKSIIYAPDGQLRYIPLAALYDGKDWLVQRFVVNHITSASLTKFDNKVEKNINVLAAAFTKGDYTVKIASRDEVFSGLQFAKVEVENLAKTIPGTKILLDNLFSPATTVPQMNDYKIVHLATHGLLVKGHPEDSFILFGNGQYVTLRDIENWSLPNVDLVVLSACQTGLGDKLGNGQEILGLGYQIQLTGAKAAIASLWSVSDGGTQALMNVFYQVLRSGNLTKAEALQKAQIALITGNYAGVNKTAEIARVRNKSSRIISAGSANEFSHPFYWAPFILIGNGL
ncbi:MULTISPECIES: CHAT domain-containing protein [unclassified Tolypothrix]|uniref:CHAT domain-containing protein n=1 Tax=unclassified Tolypothrix TaxID=2649714 RepID=UPI0005EAA6D5|nr:MULTISPECIES: tetratricopeptide repeat protein [unclassified Tolypothrix]BAY91616.1 tetratricopeptide TPR_3 [Microchaete diplosiphon NIES-3275]EKF05282.1 tetratricopeptide repeat protein [Tolypothrix sp. PCC 7601]MBE9086673.1 tetratricopeptide repeat protein [Tolypothrix sp. LEGE 11397]UYD25639.1 tetratricopeptide repeat protein [Tolypothrix sp. PCC 7712]UYD32120.1 tetratricopeptide repeat protein [Tolypothrix sp. PCC 7601]